MRRGIRRVQTPVPMPEAIRRALVYLDGRPRLYLSKPSEVAYEIWPGETFLRAQGAAGAGNRILRRAEKSGLAKWHSTDTDWGWHITAAGRAWLRDPKEIQ